MKISTGDAVIRCHQLSKTENDKPKAIPNVSLLNAKSDMV